MKKAMIRTLTAALAGAALLGTGIPAAAAATVDGSDYTGVYSTTISIRDLITPALAATTDTSLITRQLQLAMIYGQLTPADIFEMRGEGDNIPDAVLKNLADGGFIPGYIYKFYAGGTYTADDYADVFDAAYYYAANPDLASAGVTYDEDTLFQDFLTNGMALGRQGSENFNLAYFKENYPDLVATLGDNNETYYVYYIIYGKSKGLVADRLLSESE